MDLICRECQMSNREGANFCRRCGRLLVDHCPRCQTGLLPDSDFCDNCGLALTPGASVGRYAGGDYFAEGWKVPERKRGDQPAGAEETPPIGIAAPPSAEQPRPSENAPPLDRYIPADLREKLDAARSKGEMVGERRILTMLFCDVKGSTSAAEHLDPEEWTEIINGAFEHMIRPVYKYEGTVARLMGDGILAFFGAPIAHEDDPQRAVLAGLDIVRQFSAYREWINES